MEYLNFVGGQGLCTVYTGIFFRKVHMGGAKCLSGGAFAAPPKKN